MTSPFITVGELVGALQSSTRPVIFDASLVLHSPGFDGDYRRESGYPGWLDAHIPGSRHVDVSGQFSDPASLLHYTHPAPPAIADELSRLGVTAFDDVVIYDRTGTIWAARLWYLLTCVGIRARVLDGGLAAWQAGGHDVEAGDSPAWHPVATWDAVATREAWITRDQLLARSVDDDRPLVCGLPASSFTGTAPTRYSRRGRIPGSVNVSSRDLFSDKGTVLPDAELRAAYDAVGIAPGGPEVLLYCGGGISASANALTLAQIGVTAVRIYDGSLEEWSADPALPLLTGV